jgi:hypothetical protein
MPGISRVYSTVRSSGLATKLTAPDLRFEIETYDQAKIEKQLLAMAAGVALAKRYFPISIAAWVKEHPTPAKIFREEPDLLCMACRKDLMLPKPSGIVVVWEGGRKTEHVY